MASEPPIPSISLDIQTQTQSDGGVAWEASPGGGGCLVCTEDVAPVIFHWLVVMLLPVRDAFYDSCLKLAS